MLVNAYSTNVKYFPTNLFVQAHQKIKYHEIDTGILVIRFVDDKPKRY